MIRPATPGNGLPILVGRSQEQSLLYAQLSAAEAGRGGLVILSGEAGIGKTRLANDACDEADRTGTLVLVGHCYDHTETAPYGPWAELLEQYTSWGKRPSTARAVAEPNLTHSSSQATLFSEMRGFFFTVAREQPLVILLEDLHWADAASLDLLRFLARQLASVPILLLITYRSDEIPRKHPLNRLVPMLVREALAVRIDLSPLDDDAVGALIEHAYQLPADDTNRLATFIQERAEGNPFLVGELLRSVEGRALLPDPAGSWTLGALERTHVPVLLRQVIDARLARLGAEAEALLAVAAIIGQVAPLGLWARVADTTEEALFPIVEKAVEARVIEAATDGLSVRFAHALIREALYDGVLPPRRRVWHRQIGEALLAEDPHPDPDAVAYHLDRAGDRRAVDWLIRAGERAQRAFAWRTATLRFETAFARLQGDDSALNERGWLRFRLALLGRFEDSRLGVAYLEEAERLGQASDDRALAAYARFHRGMLHCQGAEFRLGIAAEEAGIAMLDLLSPADHARLTALETTSDPLDAQNGRGELTLAMAENWRLEQARSLGEQIISLPPGRPAAPAATLTTAWVSSMPVSGDRKRRAAPLGMPARSSSQMATSAW